jgi:gluconolactonase
LTLTEDGHVLLVDDTHGTRIFAFDVLPDGRLSNKRVFAELTGIEPGALASADGMALDHEGRLYVCSVTGVQVFDKSGRYLGTISLRGATNVAFTGPEKRTLYITATKRLYRLKMIARGPDRIGK